MSLNIKSYERMIVEARALRDKINQAAGMKQAQAVSLNDQRILPAIVVTVNSDAVVTYKVRPLAGAARSATEWTVNYVLSADPDTSFSVGDFVMLLLNRQGMNYILVGGGSAGGGNTYIVPTGWPVSGS